MILIFNSIYLRTLSGGMLKTYDGKFLPKLDGEYAGGDVRHGCQMAIAKFLDCLSLALRA